MAWYKWEPGLIPYMERSPDLVRGILHRCMDDYWRGFDPDLGGNTEAEKVWPVLKKYLDEQLDEFNEKAKSRHIKAENAASIRWASREMLGMPEEKRREENRIEEKKRKDSCPKPAAPDQTPVLMEIPCVGNGPKTWPLRQGKLDEWTESFPGLDVMGEIRKASQWIRDNPSKAKTFAGMPAFLGRWLSRATDAPAPGRGSAPPPPRKRTWEADEAFKSQLASYKVPMLGESK